MASIGDHSKAMLAAKLLEPARSRPSAAPASVLVLGAALAVEAARSGQLLTVSLGLVIGSLVVATGAVHGMLWELAFAALRQRGFRVRLGVWGALCGLVALALNLQLGSFARVTGPYRMLAFGVLGATLLAASLLCLILLGMQPTARHPNGWLAERRPLERGCYALALACGSVACFEADHTLFVGLYPFAHLALRLCALCLGTFALLVPWRLPRFRRDRELGYVFALLAAITGIALAERRGAEVGALGLSPWSALVLDSARGLTDVDLDGYSGWLAGGDCAPFDHAVSPGAPEVPGNGKDDNCLFGDARAEASPAQARNAARASGPSPLDVVLITIDSLRPFSMGVYDAAYGPNGFDTTPKLDAFARSARVFERAYTSGGWTSIAMSSIMRGLYPRRLDWTALYETTRFRLVRARDTRLLPQGESVTKMFPLPVGDRHATLPELLARREMLTVAVVDDEFSELLSVPTGVARGFHTQHEVDDLPRAQRSDAGTADLAIRTLARVPGGVRFFMWVHFFGPHSPTYVHPGFRIDGSSLKETYEHEVRYVDAQVGRLLRVLGERPQPTAVFVTADHGEDFPGPIDRHHGYSVDDGVVRVPLLVRVPGWGSGRTSVPVSLVDLMPTILELTRTPVPRGLDGTSITALLEGVEPRAKRTLLADTWQYDRLGRLVLAQSGAMDGRTKAIFDPLRNLWTLDQPGGAGGGRVKRAVSPNTKHPLVKALSRYIDQTGGALQLRR